MPTALPSDFLRSTAPLFGPERFGRFLSAMADEPPVSIRLNPLKAGSATVAAGEPVPWSRCGFYLERRPLFTFDPLLHGGCYYVQEAASQFVVHCAEHVLRQWAEQEAPSAPRFALDLCAAPGGKSTALRSVLPADCLLVSNEPQRQRAQVLAENMQKWGLPGSIVTCSQARDFVGHGLTQLFDLILCDVPCSGEGMFRKDPGAIGEWSADNVARCQRLQRQIVSEIWPCLRPGGVLIYSTCTYNTHENEENAAWLQAQTGAAFVRVPVDPGWAITGSLLPGFHEPVFRFIPGLTRGEGLFMTVLRKNGGDGDGRRPVKPELAARKLAAMAMDGPVAQKGKPHPEAPSPAEALSTCLDRTRHPIVELTYTAAIAYLRHEAITLPQGTPKGHVVVTFQGHPLGFVKNIGTRANNLYPREWAIRSTHVPQDYTPVLTGGPA